MWSDNGYGFCKPCLEKALAETTRKENEKRCQELADTKATLDRIVCALVGDEEPPLDFVFLHSAVEQKSSGLLKKLPGMIAGVALGGAMGEMVFGGSLLSNTATYAGDLNVLVVTQTRIFLGCCSETPFFSLNAEINQEHLQLFEAQCRAGSIARFVWARSAAPLWVTDTKLVLNRRCSCFKSELYVRNTIYQTSSLADLSKWIGKPDGVRLPDGMRCFCCGKPVVGATVSFATFFGNAVFPMSDNLGHVCTACGAVSCISCRKKAVGHNWWHGYEKARCAGCNKTNPEIKIIVPVQKVELTE